MWRRVGIHILYLCISKMTTKREHSAWGYKWTSQSLGDINIGPWCNKHSASTERLTSPPVKEVASLLNMHMPRGEQKCLS
jgi:hypothetical protein